MKAALVLGVVLLVGGASWWYWRSNGAPPAGIAAIVDFPEDYSTCTVSLEGSTNGHDISCQVVGSYLRDSLKLTPGAGVLIRPRGKSSQESWHAMTEQVHAAGFLIVPYMGRGITAEAPRGDR